MPALIKIKEFLAKKNHFQKRFKKKHIAVAHESVSKSNLRVYFQPVSLRIIKNEATHGRYKTRNIEPMTPCFAVKCNGVRVAIDVSLRRKPKRMALTDSGGKPRIFVTNGPDTFSIIANRPIMSNKLIKNIPTIIAGTASTKNIFNLRNSFFINVPKCGI